MSIKLGSLFDGIGGFPYSGIKFGITPVWASEIEPWPIKVTEKHFPGIKHLGDITQINGGEIEPVDIITFGSPCQDLSIAGKREGLSGERSGLFSHAVRIIREMRAATDGKFPRFAVWENVPGAFSSNKGQDFRAVIEEITEAEIPMPRSGKWATAGMVRTERVDVAWRTLDAQYWGVPQRRRRIFLVADFGGQCAGEILFKSEGVSRDFAEGGKAREEVTGAVGGGTEATVFNESGPGWISEGFGCLRCEGENRPSRPTHTVLIGFDNQTGQSEGIEVSPAIRSESHGSLPCVATRGIIPFDTAQITSPQNGNNPKPNDPCHPLCATAHVPSIAIPKGTDYLTGWDCQEKRIFTDKGVAPTISGSDGGGGRTGAGYVAMCINTKNNRYDAESQTFVIEPQLYDMTHADEVIRPVQEGIAPTLNSRMGTGGNQVPVMMAFTQNQREEIRDLRDKAGALAAEPGMHQQTFIYGICSDSSNSMKSSNPHSGIYKADTTRTLDLNGGNPACNQGGMAIVQHYAVRRLTPLECLRLMGFPDYWLDINEMSDTQKYKAIGNSVAIPCVKFVLGGIARVLGGGEKK